MRLSPRTIGFRSIVGSLLLAMLMASAPSPVSAATINVPDDYSTIQAAIDAASGGDTIVVKDGTYTEDLTIGTSLTIQSVNGPTTTSIVAASSGSPAVTISDVTDVTLDGFAVSGGSIGVRLTSKTTGVTLTDLAVTNADGTGISLDGSHTYVVIMDSTIGGTPKTGVYLSGELAHVQIEDVAITGTTTCGIHKPPDSTLSDISIAEVDVTPSAGPGICLEDSTASTSHVLADVEIDDATVTGGSVGIYVSNKNADSENVSVVNCDVSETSSHGIQLDSVRGGAAIANNTVSDAGDYGLHLTAATTAVAPMLFGNVLDNNANGLYLRRFDLHALPEPDQLTPAAVAFTSTRGTALYLDELSDVTVKSYDLRYAGLATGIHMETCDNMVVDGIPIGSVTTCGVSAGGTCDGITLRAIDVTCAGGTGISLTGTMSDVLIEDSTVGETPSNGVWLSGTLTMITIDNVIVTGGAHGIYMSQPDAGGGGLSITNCTISGTSSHGIQVDKVRGPAMIGSNSVSGGTGTGYGMYLVSGTAAPVPDVMLQTNTIEDCPNGLYLQSSNGGQVSRSTIRNNTGYGIRLVSCSSNTIYDNCIVDNGTNAVDDGSNTWNTSKTAGTNIIGGSYIGGNYWSDYTGEDTDDDGLGNTETPYTCGGSIASGGDNLPLVLPVCTVDLALAAGWNMVSVPLTLDPKVDAPGDVFQAAEAVYLWDPISKSYLVPEAIVAEKGYWVAMMVADTISVTGTRVMTWTDQIATGWNMCGSVQGAAVDVEDLADDPSGSIQDKAIYWWDPDTRAYMAAAQIEEGKGYWVPSVQGCDLTIMVPA